MLALSLFAPRVLAQNTPPVADAGPDQSIIVGYSAQLSGTAIDPDGDPIVAWTWTIESAPAGSSPLLSGSFTPTPILVPDLVGDYVISLVVSDGIDDSLPDTVTVSVVEKLPPVAIATADVTSGPAPLTVNFDGSQSYAMEGATLIWYDWIFGDSRGFSNEVSPTYVYSADQPYFPITFTVEFVVFDSLGQVDIMRLEITVTAPPAPVPEFALSTILLVSIAFVAYLAAARWRRKQIT